MLTGNMKSAAQRSFLASFSALFCLLGSVFVLISSIFVLNMQLFSATKLSLNLLSTRQQKYKFSD